MGSVRKLSALVVISLIWLFYSSKNMGIVTFSEILDIVGEFKRPLVEGEGILDAGMLVTVGRLGGNLAGSDERILQVWALCLQTSSLFSNPHVIKVNVDTSVSTNRLRLTSCSCKAGTSEKCKHLVAVLMYLYKTAKSSDLEELSSTDIDQQWGKLKSSVKEDYEATPIKEFCHVNEHLPVYSRGLPAIDDEQAAEFAKLIIEADKRSEIYHHKMLLREQASVKNCTQESERKEMEMKIKEAAAVTTRILEEPSAILQVLKKKTEDKVKALSSELLQFYDEKVKVGKEKCIHIASNTVGQADELWFKERSIRITGSKCYSLFTYSKNKKPDWNKKLENIFKSSFSGTDATMHGLMSEPLAREAYESQKNVKVTGNGLFIHPDLSFLGFSPDGIILNESGPVNLLEIKCPVIGKTHSASELFSEVKFCESKKLKKKP